MNHKQYQIDIEGQSERLLRDAPEEVCGRLEEYPWGKRRVLHEKRILL